MSAQISKDVSPTKGYDLKVVWKPGKRMFVPDTLSRAHQSTTITETPVEVEIHEFSNIFLYHLKNIGCCKRKLLRILCFKS